MSSQKRQQTIAKRNRELALKEKRERKQEKKRMTAEARVAEREAASGDAVDEVHAVDEADPVAPGQ